MPVVSEQELVGLEADIHEHYGEFIAKLQAEFNKGKNEVKNKSGRFIKFIGGKLKDVTDLDQFGVHSLKDPSKRKLILSVKGINLTFVLTDTKGSSITSKYEVPVNDIYQINLLPVDDNGIHRWSVLYYIVGRGVYLPYARKFTSLSEDGLFFAVRDLVVKNSAGSYEATLEAAQRAVRESLK